MPRQGNFSRKTKETDINLMLNLDGTRQINIDTGIGFFNHMLNLFAFHGDLDLNILAKGDLEVDDHHLVEDIGILIGKVFKELLGEKNGIKRYSSIYLPMDEALAFVAIDISDRAYLVFDCDFKSNKIGDFSTEMVEEFFRAVAFNAGITIHLKLMYGKNDHHKIEALFKAFGRAIKESVAIDSSINGVLSTKGVL